MGSYFCCGQEFCNNISSCDQLAFILSVHASGNDNISAGFNHSTFYNAIYKYITICLDAEILTYIAFYFYITMILNVAGRRTDIINTVYIWNKYRTFYHWDMSIHHAEQFMSVFWNLQISSMIKRCLFHFPCCSNSSKDIYSVFAFFFRDNLSKHLSFCTVVQQIQLKKVNASVLF